MHKVLNNISHYENNTVVEQSDLYNGNSYTDKIPKWNAPLES